tara:strand:- start:37094 stop:38230 length:1137 start_codon:yes stop_codon:yes gene_type:complete
MTNQIAENFQQFYKTKPEFIVRSPGRVNLIGEHTDYNDGFVLPMALDREVLLAFTPRDDQHIHIRALNFGRESADIDLSHLTKEGDSWKEYINGVAHELQQLTDKPLCGFDAVIDSNVPIGAGLSSSAAFELAIALALTQVNDIDWDATKMAVLCQAAENNWVGVNCGIMDQLICATGEQDHAVLIDCRSLALQAVPLPTDCSIVIMDTSTRRGLVESAYNERRQQCEAAAKLFGVKKLRDVSFEQLLAKQDDMDILTFKRAKHVISENDRTLAARDALLAKDPVQLGHLMQFSHMSLEQDFEVTNDALNCIVKHANNQSSCYGARMTGAGFGGCAVALVKQAESDNFVNTVTNLYQTDMNLEPKLYVCHAEAGTHLL